MDLLDRIYNDTGAILSQVTLNNIGKYNNLLVMISYSKKNPASFDEMKGICYLDVGTEIAAGGYRKNGTASGHIIHVYKVPVSGNSITIELHGTDHYQIFGMEVDEDITLIEAFVNNGTAVTSVSVDWPDDIILFCGSSQFNGKPYEQDQSTAYVTPTEMTYSAYYKNSNNSSSFVKTSMSKGPTEFVGRWFGYVVIGVVHTPIAGDINAIADWFKGTRYSKKSVDDFFMYSNTYAPYAIKFVGYKDQRVKIVGQTSQQSYEIVLDSNGEYSNLLFFTAMETLDISIEGIYSHKQAILPSTNVLTIHLAKVYHIYKDGQIINNKSVQIDGHATGRWHPDTGTAAVTNANDELTFNAWPSNTYFRESYIRTGVPVYDGDVAVLKYETNYAATNNESYNPIKNVNSDGELVITFLQPVWDMLDYRNKFQYFGMQWLDQNDVYRPLFLDPDPNNPMLRVQYGIYMYQAGNTSLVSISELTAVVYGVPEVETAI